MTAVSKPRFRAVDITFVGMFAALMAIGANITSWAPFLQVAGVPLSLQTFFAILAGLLLGSRLGALSMLVYMLIGVAGAPVFAGFSSGFDVLIGNTGGFVLSFIAVGFFAGKIIEIFGPTLSSFIFASFVGLFMNYFIGTSYMWLALNYWLETEVSYGTAWLWMVWFLVKDIVFTIFAALISPRIYKAVNRTAQVSTIQNTTRVS